MTKSSWKNDVADVACLRFDGSWTEMYSGICSQDCTEELPQKTVLLSVTNSHPEPSDCYELILSKWGCFGINHSPSAWQGKAGAVMCRWDPSTLWRGMVRPGPTEQPPSLGQVTARATGLSFAEPQISSESQHRNSLENNLGTEPGSCFLGFPYSPASPSWLSHFPISSLSVLCFWHRKILVKERVHYQTEKHFVRTFFNSKVHFPLPTVQILQSVLSVPGPKYCGVCGAGECQSPNLSLLATALGNILQPFNWCKIWLNPHHEIKSDWKKPQIKTPNQTQID